MTRSPFTLLDRPLPASHDDYEAAARELEGTLAGLAGVRAVYAYGSIRVPGISDLDRLVVVDGDVRVPTIWTQLSAATRRLAMHTPALVDPGTFRRHTLFAHVSGLRAVWGEPCPVDQPALPPAADRLLGAEGLVVLALKAAKLHVTGRVKVRSFLCEFGNFGLDLRLLGIGPHDAPHAWGVADAVDELRRRWWGLGDAARDERLRDILHGLPDAVRDAFDALPVPDGQIDAVRLSGAWRNVSLVPSAPEWPRSALVALTARSHRVAEARWRFFPRALGVGAGALHILGEAGDAEFRLERELVVRRYARVIARSPGYSPIGLALTLRPAEALA